eukprot:m.103418 g.103418  ORF g.103418 m.103418 type:complete len:191 (+) comp9055_c1_seq3:1837-2409(+)
MSVHRAPSTLLPSYCFVLTRAVTLNLPSGRGDALLASDNIDRARLEDYARTAARFYGLPDSCKFISGGLGTQLFDFSTRKACNKSCRVLREKGSSLAVFAVGDCLLEPFWPEGLGINRGFHTALDTVYVIQKCMPSGEIDDEKAMIALRETLYAKMKGLSAFTKTNIVHDNYRAYGLHPQTRYKGLPASI